MDTKYLGAETGRTRPGGNHGLILFMNEKNYQKVQIFGNVNSYRSLSGFILLIGITDQHRVSSDD